MWPFNINVACEGRLQGIGERLLNFTFTYRDVFNTWTISFSYVSLCTETRAVLSQWVNDWFSIETLTIRMSVASWNDFHFEVTFSYIYVFVKLTRETFRIYMYSWNLEDKGGPQPALSQRHGIWLKLFRGESCSNCAI